MSNPNSYIPDNIPCPEFQVDVSPWTRLQEAFVYLTSGGKEGTQWEDQLPCPGILEYEPGEDQTHWEPGHNAQLYCSECGIQQDINWYIVHEEDIPW